MPPRSRSGRRWERRPNRDEAFRDASPSHSCSRRDGGGRAKEPSLILHPSQRTAVRPQPPLKFHLAATGAPRIRIVGEDDAEGADPVGTIFVPKDSGAIRTLMGDAHRHMFSLVPSCRNWFMHPVESVGEHMLAMDGECEFAIADYQAQAFRLRFLVDGERREWICDHLRQLRCGTVQAIEVKQHPAQLDAHYRRKMMAAGSILGRLGWQVLLRYEDDIRGSLPRQDNRSIISGDGDVDIEDCAAAPERPAASGASTTYGRLCDELSSSVHAGRSRANAFIVRARVEFDMDAVLHRGSPVRLHPEPAFASAIRALAK